MSLTNTSFTSSKTHETVSRDELIQKILHQGNRLRNAMVQSILDLDPFNTEIFNDNHTKDVVPTRLRKRIPSCSSLNTGSVDVDKKRLKSFLKGESMNQRDQVEALETLRSMSSEDVCKTTNEAYSSKCTCSTCLKYYNHDLNCDLNRLKKNPLNKVQLATERKSVKEKNYDMRKYLNYVDSLQISIYDLVLNDRGNKKVNSFFQPEKKFLPLGSQTFFIEYELPYILSVPTAGMKLKKSFTTASNNNFVRICARRTSTEAVRFKHTSLHNIKNVGHIDLEGIKLKFQITCRVMRQKNVIPIGYVVFNFSNFESSPTLACLEELPVNFDDTVPIVLGHLRVNLQMGYGRLYFGNELIDCLENKPTQLVSNIREVGDQNCHKPSEILTENKKDNLKDSVAPKILQEEIEKSTRLGSNNQIIGTLKTKTILFGFIYVPEAQYTKADLNSFVACRPFCQEGNCYSELVRNDSKPLFNFYQSVPLIYDDELVTKFRDNFMVIEFWEKFDTKDILLGSTKLPLNQFYLAYRNADITKYLLNNELPVISSDWWEAIINPYTDEFVGQAQVLLALGTEKQIRNLQIDRGFRTNSVQAIVRTPLEKSKKFNPQLVNSEKNRGVGRRNEIHPKIREKVNFTSTRRPVATSDIEKSTKDQSVQFDFEMDSEIPNKEKEIDSNEKLQQILNHLVEMKNQQQVGQRDQETNTDDQNKSKSKSIIQEPESNALTSNSQYENMSPLVRSTSDLLSTLQAALSVPPPVGQPASRCQQSQQPKINGIYRKTPSSFKVHIAINQAMHLPIRKKCKAKRNKGKSVKMDDNVKPSSYVTFETMPGLDLKMTPLVQKSTSPEWKYECDAILPADLLTNNKRRLIFKVWRKSTNTNMVPNLQTDSIIGFAALDLTVLLSGLPNIKGWFNIIDLSSKCTGQINVHVTPLEDLSVFRVQKDVSHSCSPTTLDSAENDKTGYKRIPTPPLECPVNTCEDEGDGEILSRALKRKFAELDEITQRLRLRLSHVTNDDTEDENDDIAEEFEKDINTLSIEEDFDMVNFEHNVLNNGPGVSDLLQIECSSESSSEQPTIQNALCISSAEGTVDKDVEESLSILDRQLLIGKQRIDTLLGKLSLISGEMNNSRYVSGCSGSNSEEPVNIDTEAILKDLNRHSRPNINASTSYDRAMFRQIYEYPENESGGSGSNISSNTSIISHFEESRAAPDGEGNLSEDRSRVKNISM